MEKKKLIKIVALSSIGTFLIVVLVGGGGYILYTKYLNKWIKDYQISEQSKSIITEVGKVVILPVDETPQVATILNADQLKQEAEFFESAQDGDAVLFYNKNGIIILFDLKDQKLLNMGMIATSSSPTSEDASASSLNFEQ